MVSLEQFRAKMKELADRDSERKTVQASGKTVEEALEQAAIELSVEKENLEFEILQAPKRPLFGKATECLLIAYRKEQIVVDKNGTISFHGSGLTDDLFEEEISEPINGDYTVRLASDGAYVKVKPPQNGGVHVDLDSIVSTLEQRAVHNFDEEMINQVLEKSDNMYVKVGDFTYNPSNNALVSVSIEDESMTAYINATAPGAGGADLTVDEIKAYLNNNGVVYGFDEDILLGFEEHPQYGASVVVARGLPAKHGKDAKIIYNFEVDSSQVKLKEQVDGTVNFKELNLIQNVVEGQPLAKKIPPEPGREGKTVTGKYLAANDGKDVEIGLGKNVSIIDNGNTVIAKESGQVMLVKGKITVETVMVIAGDVNAQVGNVNALGAVLVKGNVEDGFSITAQGNIEVLGVVGKANLSSGADIIVKRGINGGDENEFGIISAGKSIWSSFIQNAHAEAGELVVVSDGIVNSHVDCQKKVICKGKRAQIVGGVIRAAEEINAVTLGTHAGTETVLEVGYDPKSKEEMDLMIDRITSFEKELDEVDKNIQGLIRQKKVKRKSLSPEKEKMILQLREQHNDLVNSIKENQEEVEKREKYLHSLSNRGKISASKQVHTGVVLKIKDADLDIKRPFDAVTFVLENGIIKSGAYEEVEEDLEKGG